MKRIAIALTSVLLLAGCASGSQTNASDLPLPTDSSSASQSGSQSAKACTDADQQVAIGKSNWQVCLPAEVASQLTIADGKPIRAKATVSGLEVSLAAFEAVDDAGLAKLPADAWTELAAGNGQHLLISAEYSLPGNATADQLKQAQGLAQTLAEAWRYSAAD